MGQTKKKQVITRQCEVLVKELQDTGRGQLSELGTPTLPGKFSSNCFLQICQMSFQIGELDNFSQSPLTFQEIYPPGCLWQLERGMNQTGSNQASMVQQLKGHSFLTRMFPLAF